MNRFRRGLGLIGEVLLTGLLCVIPSVLIWEGAHGIVTKTLITKKRGYRASFHGYEAVGWGWISVCTGLVCLGMIFPNPPIFRRLFWLGAAGAFLAGIIALLSGSE